MAQLKTKTGTTINNGDKIADFRGKQWTLVCLSSNSSKVYAEDTDGNRREFFPNVFDCEIIRDQYDPKR